MKRFLLIIFFVLLMHPFFASSVSEGDVSNAFVAITDLGYVSASNFISLQRENYESIAIRISQDNLLPEAILFSDADLSTYISYFNKEPSSNFLASFLPSINPIVLERLELNDWKKGEAIVTGAAALVFPDNLTMQKLISDGSMGIFPRVGVSFNFSVYGSLFKEAVNIKGILLVSSDSYGVPQITPIRLNINNQDYDLSFFERAPLLLTMKNDI
ncbi:MAG: hypothetical protein EOL97_04685 [Spirochaetia bacterium]|nr:hypothetical protein [Spirochaetia bacterium]